MKRMKLQFLNILMALVVVAALTGCATVEHTLLPTTTKDIAALRGELTSIKVELVKKADSASVAKEITKLESEVTKRATKDELAAAKSEFDKRGAELTAKFSGYAEKTALEATEKKVGAVSSSVTKLASTTKVLGGRLGGLEEDAGYDREKTVFRIGPFPVAKYDDAKKEMVAGSELGDGFKAAIREAKKVAADRGHTKAVVIGYADGAQFKEKDGKVRSDSDELNKQIATLRAEKVAGYLKELGVSDPQSEGRGSVVRFGTHEMNRTVRLVFTK